MVELNEAGKSSRKIGFVVKPLVSTFGCGGDCSSKAFVVCFVTGAMGCSLKVSDDWS